MSELEYYSVRRLCPFLGTAQFLESDNARALSIDGENWEIQVRTERPSGLWANTPNFSREYFRFGVWSPRDGLGRVPLNPILNTDEMIRSADKLLAVLPSFLTEIPFAFRDNVELWLLGKRDRSPLALVASALATTEMAPRGNAPRWMATLPGDHSFRDKAVTEGTNKSESLGPPRLAAERIERQVRNSTGSPPLSAWFQRLPDGSAQAIDPEAMDSGRRHPSTDFPPLLLRSRWESSTAERLVDRFFGWQAPRLLMLDRIPDELRDRLEYHAIKKPSEVDKFWRLYPRVLNPDLLKTARVEARLRRTNETKDPVE